MTIWILAAMVGGLLSLVGFWILAQRFRRGEVRGRYLLAFVVGYISLASYALLSALRPAVMSGPIRLGILLPALVAIVALVHEHQRMNKVERSAR